MLKRIVLLVALAGALAACGAGGNAGAPTPAAHVPHTISDDSRLLAAGEAAGLPAVGETAPDFQYTLGDGSVHTLAELRGKKVLLNFWATWCEPCRDEMPALQRAQGDYGDAVVILGVNKQERPDVIAPFADELAISFLLIANPQGDIADRYGAQNIPTSYFINRDGTIGFHKLGVMTYDLIKEQLDKLN